MSSNWNSVSDDEILNFTGTRDNPNTARYERILQKRMIDAAGALSGKLTGLMETLYRASQGLQQKTDDLIATYARSVKSQGRQQGVTILLSVVVAVSTAVYTWITWQSVIAMREANDIQRELLNLQKEASLKPSATKPAPQDKSKERARR